MSAPNKSRHAPFDSYKRAYYVGGYESIARVMESPLFNKPQREVLNKELAIMRQILEDECGAKFSDSKQEN